MKLQLSRSFSTTNVLLSAVSDSGDNLTPLYYIHTPGLFTRKTSFIYKIAPDVAERFKGRGTLKEEDLASQEEIARIHWHMVSCSKLVYNGEIVTFKELMPRRGFWGIARGLQGTDGRSYVWKESINSCHLDVDDGSKPTVKVAQFHQRNILTGRKANLEIFPEGDHMLDLIVITWHYIETRRRDKEKRNSGGGG
ncbi:hypothetical protein K474DRAFT_1703916 [Panus rudis PR-1116 ss-1]|nr:hypothetical protein K474DRAFT_1703916 [Panus rudis PR-1116 ss-1]